MTHLGPHHWLIQCANGPTSRGVCKFCGESRKFRNAPLPEDVKYRVSTATTQTDRDIHDVMTSNILYSRHK